MPVLRQFILAAVVAFVALTAAVAFVPAARPFAARIGLLGPLERIGLAGEPAANGGNDAAGQGKGAKGAQAPVPVIAAAPKVVPAGDRIISVGSARAVRSVAISPEVTARLVSIEAPSGTYAEKGAVIARLDDQAPRIALDRAEVVLADARATAERMRTLRATGASSVIDLQQAELALRTAELGQNDAAFQLSQYTLHAPVAGWVGIWAADPGDQVAQNTALTRIEDRSSLIVDFRVPERVAAMLRPGLEVRASPLADPTTELKGMVSAIDNRVDEASRTLRVQAQLDNAGGAYLPGMAFRITVAIVGQDHPAVDPLAIQWNSDGPYVWLVRDGKAARAPVRILQRDTDRVLVDLDLKAGDLVVSEGVQALRPGADVDPRQPGSAATPPAKG